MQIIKYFTLILCLTMIVNTSVLALSSKDADTKEYLLNHGHSPEVIRMIELQNKRLCSEDIKIKKHNRFVKFWKNLRHERDLTMPLRDFGHTTITSPETL